MTKNGNPVYCDSISWKGVPHRLELFPIRTLEEDERIVQVQGVPIDANGMIGLYLHVDGYWGLPGGHVEDEEEADDALRREFDEEGGLEIVSYRPIFMMVDTNLETCERTIQMRYAASVKRVSEVCDPDGKAIKLEFFSVDEAIKQLDWGKLGEMLVREAVSIQL